MTDWVRRGAILCAALLIIGAAGSSPVVAASVDRSAVSVDTDDENEAPLADAGLDQEVPVNATVYLDASGSRDPDGSIASYEWSIERPDGTPTSPRCDTCARSEFRAGMVGTYAVTVTVTDDDGATRSDTLYVTVSDVEGPSVDVSGPTTVTAGRNVTFQASATAGEEPLMRLDWAINGSETTSEDVHGPSATDEVKRHFDPGTYELSVEVISELGRTDTATLFVEVTANASRQSDQCSEATLNLSQGDSDTSGCESSNSSTPLGDLESGDSGSRTACSRYDRDDEHYCNNDRVLYGSSEKIIIHDADNDGEVTLHGETLSANLSDSGVGRSYTMTRSEYKERFGVDTVTPDPSQRRDQPDTDTDEEEAFGNETTDGGDSESEDDAVNHCENVPSDSPYRC